MDMVLCRIWTYLQNDLRCWFSLLSLMSQLIKFAVINEYYFVPVLNCFHVVIII